MKLHPYITKLALINVLKKRQRTGLSIFSVLLSSAIVYTSLTLFLNIAFFSNSANYAEIGNYHYAVSQVEEIELSSRYLVTKDSDTGYYGVYNDTNINLRVLEVSQDTHMILPFSIMEGRLPNNDQEVLISNTLNKQLGDTISLDVGSKVFDMKVVGIYLESSFFGDDTLPMYTKTKTTHPYMYYVKDQQVHLSSSVETLVNKMNVEIEDVILNQDVITTDTMKIYMQDTTLILILFIMIMGIGIGMSLISLYNVILVSDQSRKKEIGLLKSVGASPTQIKQLLHVELFVLGMIGSVLGSLLGIGISYAVLSSFVDKIYVTLDKSMYIHPLLMLVSMFTGCGLMLLSGMKAYRKYIFTLPIEDLKEVPFDYAKLIDKRNKKDDNASWNLFLIYNERMRAQTRNIQYSFMLLLISTILFACITLSNITYQNTYHESDFDFIINNTTTDISGWTDLNFDFAYALYDEKENGKYGVESVYAKRTGLNGYLTQPSIYEQESLDYQIQYYQQDMQFEKDVTGKEWCDLFYIDTILDERQFKWVKDYVEFHDVDWEPLIGDLTQDYIMIASNVWNPTHMYRDIEIGKNTNIGTYSLRDGINISNRDIASEGKMINGVVFLDAKNDFQLNDLYFPLDNTRQIMARIGTDDSDKDFFGVESFEIKLKNSVTADLFQERLDEIIIETNTQNMYEYINVASTVETMKYATFLIEVLLYPLFLMLFIISLLNLFNVFSGNVHLKRKDISTLKLIGMKNKQVYSMFIFEYLEGYMNGAFMIGVVFVVMAYIEKNLGYISALKLGDNIIGTLISSLFVLGPILILPIAMLTIRQVKKIRPNEHTKDME